LAETIRILSLSEHDARDLSDALARRGLNGAPVRLEGGWEVDLVEKREETGRLLDDLTAALVTWLDDRRRTAVALRVGTRGYMFDSHSGLADDERALG